MLEPSHLPGIRWFDAIRNETLRMGVYGGICLSVVFIAWLFLANRVPVLERFALERNIAAAALFGVLAAVPLFLYVRRPLRLFLSGEVAWFLFSVVYRMLIFFFHGLALRLTALHLFVLGAVVYGLMAMMLRILYLILSIRHAASSPHGGAHHLP
jgi:hypothetical protein